MKSGMVKKGMHKEKISKESGEKRVQKETNLHDRVEVTRIAEVHHAGKARPEKSLQRTAILLNDGPLVVSLVEVNLHFDHGFLGLGHGGHIDAKVRQVLHQLGIIHHVVLIVRVHIGARGRDGAQLHHQWVLRLLEVLLGVVVATGAVKVSSTTVDRAVG